MIHEIKIGYSEEKGIIITGIKCPYEEKLEAVKTTRNKLYEALPTGDVDAFDLIKVINNHIAELDMILEVTDA